MTNDSEDVLNYRFTVEYNKRSYNHLADLCDLHGSDKGSMRSSRHPFPWPAHTYADFYARLFDHCRWGVRKVFECGLGTSNLSIPSNMGANGRPGASLRVWRDYFPNAQVFGGDIDRAILFEEERIRTFHLDQTKPSSIGAFWDHVRLDDFDLMIDDGLHEFDAGTCLFENSLSRLGRDGIYVIEDVTVPDLRRYSDFFGNKNLSVDYVNMRRRNLPLQSNCLVVIRNLQRSPAKSPVPQDPG